MFRHLVVRTFHTTRSLQKTSSKKIPKNGKSHSSNQWLERQMKDPFVEMAKMKNYRCRSAFKLLEIDERVKLLHPGQTVIDCGAAPGSWTEIAVDKTNANGKIKNKPIGTVIGIDLLSIYPIEGAHLLSHMDFISPKTKEKIRSLIGDKKINCIMSDMAPNATGVRSLDQEKIMNLCYDVLRFAIEMSAEDASLLVKVWDNGDVRKFEAILLQYYGSCKDIKPNASRSDSAEKFILARGFIGFEKAKQLALNSKEQ